MNNKELCKKLTRYSSNSQDVVNVTNVLLQQMAEVRREQIRQVSQVTIKLLKETTVQPNLLKDYLIDVLHDRETEVAMLSSIIEVANSETIDRREVEKYIKSVAESRENELVKIMALFNFPKG